MAQWNSVSALNAFHNERANMFSWETSIYSRSDQAQHCDINGHRLYVRKASITRDYTLHIDGIYAGRSKTMESGKRVLEVEAAQRGFVERVKYGNT
jgi:hypothetical protein